MRAEIIAIGSELVSGQSLDTNSQWLSQELSDLGIVVAFHTTLGDILADHLAAFRAACQRAELVVITGGLGPTQDDLTREALAECAERSAGRTSRIARRHRGHVRPTESRHDRAKPGPGALSAGCDPAAQSHRNRSRHLDADRTDATCACLPGVPIEMKLMFQEEVVPRLRDQGLAIAVFVHRKINLFGKGEAEIESQAFDLTARGRMPEVGITAHDGTISFRIIGWGDTEEEAELMIKPTAELIYERFGSLVVGEGSDDVAEGLVAQLARTGATLATAESCTGGLIAHLLTAIAGVSAYYQGGVVSYANLAKSELLGVPPQLIESHGAVSPEVAAAMAEGVRNRLSADIGISTTGVAGPGGGTPHKPVGLVYIGLATAHGTKTRRLDIGAEQPRDVIQSRSSKAALNWARLSLLAE